LRLLLIVNASASSVTARARVVIQKALAADHQVTVAETSRRGHATRLAQGAAAAGLDVVAVLGGDGTLNEAANGLAGTQTALAPLPGGSTNVFARTIGFTNDPIEATGELLGALGDGRIFPVGLGNVNGRYFLFHVGVGFDATVVAQVERRAALKRYLGPALFIGAAFTSWLHYYDRSHPHFSVKGSSGTGPGTIDLDDGYFGIVMKTNPYTFLGNRPLDVAPGTSLERGLTVVTFRALDLPTIVAVAVDSLRGGRRSDRHRRVRVDYDLDHVVIDAPAPVPYQVDGDYLGDATSLTLRWETAAMRLVLPDRRPA
jgi:diacylglycerol kinase family enzyme